MPPTDVQCYNTLMALKLKEALRQKIGRRRQHLDPKLVESWSQSIAERCLELVDWERVTSLHSYLPISDLHEVDTWPLLEHLRAKFPHIVMAVPRVSDDQTMEAVVVTAETRWRHHRWGMSEPTDGAVLPPDFQFDVILVPVLAFDRYGHRLGYGGGFYDRFLADQPDALTIGLAYHLGYVKEGLPSDKRDIALKRIVTENGVVMAVPKPQSGK